MFWRTDGVGAAVGGLTVLLTMGYGVREMRKAKKAGESEDAEWVRAVEPGGRLLRRVAKEQLRQSERQLRRGSP